MKILASTQDLLEQKRSLQRELSVPKSISDSDLSAGVSEVPDSSEAPGQYTGGIISCARSTLNK